MFRRAEAARGAGGGAPAAHLARRSGFLNAAGRVVGTCTDIQKDYLRPAEVPDPAAVRTEHTLKKAVVLFGRGWAEVLRSGSLRPRAAPSARDPDPPYDPRYLRYRSRLKAIRYDYQVQGIVNKYSVRCLEDTLFAAAAANDSAELPLCFDLLFDMYRKLLGPAPQCCENAELALWVYFCFSLVEGRLCEFEAYAAELLALVEPQVRQCSARRSINAGPASRAGAGGKPGGAGGGGAPGARGGVQERVYALLTGLPPLVSLYFERSPALPGLVRRAVAGMVTTARTKSEPVECLPVLSSALLPRLEAALAGARGRAAAGPGA